MRALPALMLSLVVSAVLDGLVTDGWQIGAQVHVELRPVACSQSASGCFTGTLRVR
jgi:hypothetical protein